MNERNPRIQPFVRLFFLVAGIGSIACISNIWLLLGFYAVVLLPILISSNLLRGHIRFLLLGTLPIFISFVILYIVALKETQGDWSFILRKTTRISLAAFVVQLTLSIPPSDLIRTFNAWKIKGDALIIVLGTFTVWEDVIHRADKVITARFSRGFVGKRTIWNKARQFPFVLIPLVVGVLRASTERSQSWHQKDIANLLENIHVTSVPYPLPLNAFLSISSLLWLIVAIASTL